MPFQRQPTAAETAAEILAAGVQVVERQTVLAYVEDSYPAIGGVRNPFGGTTQIDCSGSQSIHIRLGNMSCLNGTGIVILKAHWYNAQVVDTLGAGWADNVWQDKFTFQPSDDIQIIIPARARFVQFTVEIYSASAYPVSYHMQVRSSQREVRRPFFFQPIAWNLYGWSEIGGLGGAGCNAGFIAHLQGLLGVAGFWKIIPVIGREARITVRVNGGAGEMQFWLPTNGNPADTNGHMFGSMEFPASAGRDVTAQFDMPFSVVAVSSSIPFNSCRINVKWNPYDN